MAVTAIIAASSAYSVYSSEKQRSEAKDQQKKQEARANKLAAEQEERDNIQKATEKRDSARSRQRLRSQGSQGRADTVLAGGYGTGVRNQGARKTLLGV